MKKADLKNLSNQTEAIVSTSSLASNYDLIKMPRTTGMTLKLHFQSKKIRAFEQTDFDILYQCLNGCAYLMGLRTKILQQEFDIIKPFLIRQFGDISSEEIKEAIELWASKKLEFKDSHFQSMDITFLGNVLSSYRKYRTQELSKAEHYRLHREAEPDKELIRGEYIQNAIVAPYRAFIKTGDWAFSFEDRLYDFFDARKAINITIDRKKELFEEARRILVHREKLTAKQSTGSATKAKFMKSAEDIEKAIPGGGNSTVRREAKKLAFREFIQDCADFERDIEELLKNQ